MYAKIAHFYKSDNQLKYVLHRDQDYHHWLKYLKMVEISLYNLANVQQSNGRKIDGLSFTNKKNYQRGLVAKARVKVSSLS